jgi:beta-phosphoglucomutase
MSTNKSLRTLIFDFNGVIIDDEPIHNQNLKNVFGDEGIELSLEDIRTRCHGRGDYECIGMLLREAGRNPTEDLIEEFVKRKSAYYRESIDTHIPLTPGIQEFLERAHGKIPIGLASGALQSEIDYVLARADLRKFFAITANIAEVEHPKPDPGVYQLALERLQESTKLNIAPSECLVFEDSPVGMRAALSAGMRCIGVATSVDENDLAKAEFVIQDYLDSRIDGLLNELYG